MHHVLKGVTTGRNVWPVELPYQLRATGFIIIIINCFFKWIFEEVGEILNIRKNINKVKNKRVLKIWF